MAGGRFELHATTLPLESIVPAAYYVVSGLEGRVESGGPERRRGLRLAQKRGHLKRTHYCIFESVFTGCQELEWVPAPTFRLQTVGLEYNHNHTLA